MWYIILKDCFDWFLENGFVGGGISIWMMLVLIIENLIYSGFKVKEMCWG